MGLDWCLNQHKARPGCEERYAVVSRMLNQMRDDGAESHSLQEEFKSLAISIYEVLGAPRVGFDERANEWFRKNVYEPCNKNAREGDLDNYPNEKSFWLQDFATCLELKKGLYVMELAEDRGGFASITGVFVTPVDFRGKVLRYIEGLDSKLVDESYQDHTAEECLDYAARLEVELPKVPDGEDGKELLRGAINWLRFWGSRGFGFWAWY